MSLHHYQWHMEPSSTFIQPVLIKTSPRLICKHVHPRRWWQIKRIKTSLINVTAVMVHQLKDAPGECFSFPPKRAAHLTRVNKSELLNYTSNYEKQIIMKSELRSH